MDAMRIQGKIMTGIISRLIEKELRKKGLQCEIRIDDISFTIVDGKANVGVTASCTTSEENLAKILNF